MSRITIPTIQNKEITYVARQGNLLALKFDWLEVDESGEDVPMDLTGYSFFGQIRSDKADKPNSLVFTFPASADADGNRFEITIEDASVTFYFSDELTRTLKPGQNYYFECKLLDAGGNRVNSIVSVIKFEAEYARGEVLA